jgi:hypothetical protein
MGNQSDPTPDAVDEALLSQLRTVASVVDGVPAHVVEAAKATFILRDLDAELAALVSDSVEDGADPVLTRTDGTLDATRTLTFEAGDRTIDVQVTATESSRRLVGLATGFGPGDVTLERVDGPDVSAPIDPVGRFALDAPPGAARLRIVAADGTTVVTAWTTL